MTVTSLRFRSICKEDSDKLLNETSRFTKTILDYSLSISNRDSLLWLRPRRLLRSLQKLINNSRRKHNRARNECLMSVFKFEKIHVYVLQAISISKPNRYTVQITNLGLALERTL